MFAAGVTAAIQALFPPVSIPNYHPNVDWEGLGCATTDENNWSFIYKLIAQPLKDAIPWVRASVLFSCIISTKHVKFVNGDA